MMKSLKYAAALWFGFPVLAAAAGMVEYTSQEAASHEGERAAVCGLVSGVHSSQKAWFINLDGNYPNQRYTFVIWKSDWPGSAPDLSAYEGSRLCAEGKISSYRGSPQTIVRSPEQLYRQDR